MGLAAEAGLAFQYHMPQGPFGLVIVWRDIGIFKTDEVGLLVGAEAGF